MHGRHARVNGKMCHDFGAVAKRVANPVMPPGISRQFAVGLLLDQIPFEVVLTEIGLALHLYLNTYIFGL